MALCTSKHARSSLSLLFSQHLCRLVSQRKLSFAQEQQLKQEEDAFGVGVGVGGAGRIRLTPQDIRKTIESMNDPDGALRFLDWAGKQLPHFSHHDSLTYSALIKILAKSQKFGKIWEILESMKRSGVRPQECDFHVLIKHYCEDGNHSRAIHALEVMPNYGVFPSSETYHTLLNYLIEKEEKKDLAMNVCKRMIVKFSEAGDMENAFCVFNQVKEKKLTPDVFTMNALINGFSKDLTMDSALGCLSDMKDMGIRPDVVTYRHIIRGLCGKGKVDDAIARLKEMKCDHIKPDITIYSVLMYCFCNLGRIEEGSKFLNEILAEGGRVDSLVYSVLVSAYCKSDRLDEACVLCAKMLNNGYKPLDSAHSFLILGLCKIKKYEEARYFNDLIDERHRSKCPVENLEMIKAQSFKDEVGHLLSTMISKGYSVMKGTSIHKESYPKCSIKNFTHMVSEKECEKEAINASYTLLIKTLCDDRRVDYAYQLHQAMLDNGFTPNAESYKIMISRTNKMGDACKALELLCEMEKNGLKPDSSLYDELVQGLCKGERADTNIKKYIPFLNKLQEQGKITEVASVWDMIYTKGIFRWISV